MRVEIQFKGNTRFLDEFENIEDVKLIKRILVVNKPIFTSLIDENNYDLTVLIIENRIEFLYLMNMKNLLKTNLNLKKND